MSVSARARRGEDARSRERPVPFQHAARRRADALVTSFHPPSSANVTTSTHDAASSGSARRPGNRAWSHLAPPHHPPPHHNEHSRHIMPVAPVARTPEFRRSSHHHFRVHAETEPSFGRDSDKLRPPRERRERHGGSSRRHVERSTVQFTRNEERAKKGIRRFITKLLSIYTHVTMYSESGLNQCLKRKRWRRHETIRYKGGSGGQVADPLRLCTAWPGLEHWAMLGLNGCVDIVRFCTGLILGATELDGLLDP